MSDDSDSLEASAGGLSAVEKAKLASNYPRGEVAEELANAEDHFAKDASLVSASASGEDSGGPS